MHTWWKLHLRLGRLHWLSGLCVLQQTAEDSTPPPETRPASVGSHALPGSRKRTSSGTQDLCNHRNKKARKGASLHISCTLNDKAKRRLLKCHKWLSRESIKIRKFWKKKSKTALSNCNNNNQVTIFEVYTSEYVRYDLGIARAKSMIEKCKHIINILVENVNEQHKHWRFSKSLAVTRMARYLASWSKSLDRDESVVFSAAPHRAAEGRKARTSGGSRPHLYLNPASTGSAGSENRRGYFNCKSGLCKSFSEAPNTNQ